jgi:hypothetical protein
MMRRMTKNDTPASLSPVLLPIRINSMNLIEKLAPAFFHRPLQIVVEHVAQLRISAKTIFAISNALALNRQRFKVFETQQSEVVFTPNLKSATP